MHDCVQSTVFKKHTIYILFISFYIITKLILFVYLNVIIASGIYWEIKTEGDLCENLFFICFDSNMNFSKNEEFKKRMQLIFYSLTEAYKAS